MFDSLAPLPPRYLRTPEAARMLSLSIRTLEKYRQRGNGPIYRKIGGRVIYDFDDIKTWVDRYVACSTGKRGARIVLRVKQLARIPYAGKSRC
jgi:predicted DNA-binding transcriptional regulator AlpA